MFFVFNKRLFIFVLTMFFGMFLWMAYYIYFRTDGKGHVTREADSPEAEARGRQLLNRADNLLNQRQYDAAKTLLDSLQDADLNPAMFIANDALEQRMDTLRRRRFREKAAQK